MTTPYYKVHTGFNVAVGSMSDIDPQPATIGMEYTREQYAASGIVVQELAFVRLNWSMLDPVSQYTSLLTQFGLSSATTSEVSVYIQDERFGWIVRNAIAVLPMIGQQGSRNNYFLRDFTILLKNLQAQP